MTKIKFKKGFTLIELLVVISIIGLLASVVLVALNSARQKSRDGARISTAEQLAKAMELYFNTALSYPTITPNLAPNVTCVIGSAANNCLTNLVPGFLAKLPIAPQPADGNCAVSYGGGGGFANDYQFAGTAANLVMNTYTITFCLGNSTGNFSAGVHTLSPSGIQ